MIDNQLLAAWIKAYAALVDGHQDELTELDSAIGDADHGANMARGMAAAVQKLDEAAAPAAMLKAVGMALISSVGGASGPLYGTLFMKVGAGLTSDDITPEAFGAALRAGLEGVSARGKSEAGEKTMLDALAPAVDAFERAANEGLAAAARAAAEAANAGRDATIPMVATKGRASYLGERSAGHQDPGATSTALLFEALAQVAES